MNELQVFNFDMFPVRTVKDDAGDPWFVAKDVCDILEIGNPSQALSYLDNDERCLITNEALRQNGEINIVSESGLYSLIFRSRKPEAQKFRKWITAEVLPAIRKTGGYVTHGTITDWLKDPHRTIEALQALLSEQERTRQLAAQIEAGRPKFLLAEAITAAPEEILVGTLAKLIYQATGFDTGEKRLYQYFRENGFVCVTPNRWNLPTQRSIEQGLMRIKEEPYISANGNRHISSITMITTKGQEYFIDYFRKLADALPTAPEEGMNHG